MANNPMKLTKVQLENIREYNRQIGYTKSMLTRAKNRGWIFDDDLIPDLTTIDHVPRKKDIEKLKRARKHLYEQGFITDYSTGEIIEGQSGRTYEKKLTPKQREERLSIKSALENEEIQPPLFDNPPRQEYDYEEYEPSPWEDVDEDIGTPFDEIYDTDYTDYDYTDEADLILDNLYDRLYAIMGSNETSNGEKRNPKEIDKIRAACQRVIDAINNSRRKLGDKNYSKYLVDHASEADQCLESAEGYKYEHLMIPVFNRLINIVSGTNMTLQENQELSDLIDSEQYFDEFI